MTNAEVNDDRGPAPWWPDPARHPGLASLDDPVAGGDWEWPGRAARERPADRAPARPGPAWLLPRERLVIAGAHGGAGTSTLATLLPAALDAGVLRPGHAPAPRALGDGPVVLAARGTALGAERAIAVARAMAGCGARLVAVAVVSDGLPEPVEAAYRYRLLDYRVPVVRVPFVPALRSGASPRAVALPRRARRALERIRELASSPENTPARA